MAGSCYLVEIIMSLRKIITKCAIFQCVKAENFKAASILETMAENYEQALQHNLAGAGSSTVGCGEAINKYLNSIDHTRNPSVEQV